MKTEPEQSRAEQSRAEQGEFWQTNWNCWLFELLMMKMDGKALPKGRWRMDLGNLIISNLRRIDFGYYECHMSNEVATLVATTHLVIEGTTPHAPHNISTESTEFSIKLDWLPGYSGGSDYSQNYEVRSVDPSPIFFFLLPDLLPSPWYHPHPPSFFLS